MNKYFKIILFSLLIMIINYILLADGNTSESEIMNAIDLILDCKCCSNIIPDGAVIANGTNASFNENYTIDEMTKKD